MLYQALTGCLPHVGKPHEILVAKQRDDPRPPIDLEPSTPEDLSSLCMDLLARDPGRRPSGDEIIRRLAGGSVGTASPSVSSRRTTSIPLVGRSRHLEALALAFDEVKRGSTGVVCVHGRSGAGKSALVQHFLEGLVDREEVVILSGRCYEQESVPYKALDSLVDALSRYLNRLPAHQVEALLPRDVHPLTRVFPVLQRVGAIASAPRAMADPPDPNELRRRAFSALRELLARLGDRRPLILAIDDLQWGDADSAVLLSELFRPPHPPVMLAIASYRDDDATTNPFLRTLPQWCLAEGTNPTWRDLKVEELTPDEACSLATTLMGESGAVSAEQAGVIARESVGNPFFVHELVQSLRAGGTDRRRAAWLRSILDRTLLDEVRRIGRAKRGPGNEGSLLLGLDEVSSRLESCLASPDPSPSQVAIGHERLMTLAGALDRLPEDQRRAVELHYLKGRPLVEIGRELGRSKAAVAGLLRRGLRDLRGRIEPEAREAVDHAPR